MLTASAHLIKPLFGCLFLCIKTFEIVNSLRVRIYNLGTSILHCDQTAEVNCVIVLLLERPTLNVNMLSFALSAVLILRMFGMNKIFKDAVICENKSYKQEFPTY